MEEDTDLRDRWTLFSFHVGTSRKLRLQYYKKYLSLSITEIIKRAVDKYLDELDVQYQPDKPQRLRYQEQMRARGKRRY